MGKLPAGACNAAGAAGKLPAGACNAAGDAGHLQVLFTNNTFPASFDAFLFFSFEDDGRYVNWNK